MVIPVARLWHKRGKMEYFCLRQLIETFPNIEFEFHIVLDNFDYKDEWSKKIEDLPYLNVTWYSTQSMLNYAKDCDYIDDEFINKIPNFVHFYHIIIFHYLRRILKYDYALAYEFDIIFNNKDLTELENCIKNKIPFGICEPSNAGCDKALYQQLSNLFQADFKLLNEPYFVKGINAGFQGMNLKLFDNFLNPTSFKDLLNCFNFSGIYKEDGSEKTGWERTTIDTQEQSFHSLMNVAVSPNFILLNPEEYFFYPYWLDINKVLQSKVIHYFGHEKPKEMIETIESRLQLWKN